MIAIFSLLTILTLSLVITRIATMALVMTGLSRDTAKFQARSAYCGVGFTTSESESIAVHPVRRRIIMLLMLMGNVGIATVVATLMISFLDSTQSAHLARNMLLLGAGLVTLWTLASSKWIERHMNRLIGWAIRRFTTLDVRDYVSLLHLSKGFVVTEITVNQRDWIANKSLIELKLPAERVIVLGIKHSDGVYVGAPTGQTIVQPGDVLIAYGPDHRIKELNARPAGFDGDLAHEAAVAEMAPTE